VATIIAMDNTNFKNKLMKKSVLTFVSMTLIWIVSIAQNQVTAPKIINTIPNFGDCNVDPNLKEIIIKFDQDMTSGMSLLNTQNMPENNGQPKWVDKRTYIIPVKLYPNKLYSLAFNNSKFQNFTNVEGIPLNPDELHFKTKAIAFEELNKKAFNELKEFFPKQYSYASLKGIKWDSLMEASRPELENAETNTEFALKLVKLLRVCDDPHLWIEVDGQKFITGNVKIMANNTNSVLVFQKLHDQKVSKGFMAISGIYDSIGYISFKDWNTDFDNLYLKDFGNSKNPEISALSVLKELLVYPNLVIDVRENQGGNESFAKKFASLFLTDSIAYEKVMYYNDKSGKFDKEKLKWLLPGVENLKYSGNIYVLTGPSVMSSNESFILMMKQVPNAKVVGMKTYGSSGNPIPHELSNGVTIYLPSWQAYSLDGKLIEGNGIEPDIKINTTKADFKDNDGLFDKVMTMIKTVK
jgi:hypothetical protein